MQHISCAILVHGVQVATWHYTTRLWSLSGANSGLSTVHAHPALLMVCDLFCAVSVCMYCPQLRDWLMDKDVVKVMKKGKRGKGYKYSKLPKDISTSMKHLE